MSKETINLDLSLAPPHSSQLQSLPAVQESPGESLHDRKLQVLPSPAVQEPFKFSLIEVPYGGPQVPFYNFSEPKNGYNTRIQREITSLHPWAKLTGFEVHTLNYLVSKNITKISGEMMCKSCKKIERLEYNLKEKFEEVCNYIKENIKGHRASKEWMRPKSGRCSMCRSCSLKPVISENTEEINWLFLMLGQMLGWCSKDQIRYFCEKNKERRGTTKDHLVYIANGVICNQLDSPLSFEF